MRRREKKKKKSFEVMVTVLCTLVEAGRERERTGMMSDLMSSPLML